MQDSRSYTDFNIKKAKTDFRNSNQNAKAVKTKRDSRSDSNFKI